MSDYALIFRALSFAAGKHRAQRRKDEDSSPYINHPIEVARLLAEVVGVTDGEVLAAAVLHDTIEDTETSAEELGAEFGSRVTGLVLELTDDKSLPKARRKQLQVENAAKKSKDACLIKLADKSANVKDVLHNPPSDWSKERKREYLEWARAVVSALPYQDPSLLKVFNALTEMPERS